MRPCSCDQSMVDRLLTTYDGRRVVIPNAELFTHSVTVNTAFEMRRWEYELSTKAPYGLGQLKVFVVDTITKVEGVLSSPVTEALVVDLRDPDARVVKLRLTWWTKSPRQHEMIASHDRVLTAIRQASLQLGSKQSPDARLRAA